MIQMTIEEPIHSGNIILRSHWGELARIRKTYEWMIVAALADAGKRIPDEASQRKMKVRITSYRARLLDTDRLYEGATILVDALRATRLIKNDSPRWLDLKCEQEIDSENMRTKITIENSGGKEKRWTSKDSTEQKSARNSRTRRR